jgi:hypothetical protein
VAVSDEGRLRIEPVRYLAAGTATGVLLAHVSHPLTKRARLTLPSSLGATRHARHYRSRPTCVDYSTPPGLFQRDTCGLDWPGTGALLLGVGQVATEHVAFRPALPAIERVLREPLRPHREGREVLTDLRGQVRELHREVVREAPRSGSRKESRP